MSCQGSGGAEAEINYGLVAVCHWPGVGQGGMQRDIVY